MTVPFDANDHQESFVDSTTNAALLVIDAGNTRTKFGLFDDCHERRTLPVCRHFAAIRCEEPPPWSIVREWVGDNWCALRSVVTGSNPQSMAAVEAQWPNDLCKPLIVTDYRMFPLSIEVSSPERVGIDRLLNAVAGNLVRAPGEPLVIVDSGTATTVDALNAEGRFVGGAILPGLELSAKALHRYTALLPEIPRSDFTDDPPAPIGTDTVSALRSGIYWGQIGAITRLVEGVSAGLVRDPDTECPVLLTGGAAPVLRSMLPQRYRWEPALPMQGLALTMLADHTVFSHKRQ